MTTKYHEVWRCPECDGDNDEFAASCEWCGEKFKKRDVVKSHRTTKTTTRDIASDSDSFIPSKYKSKVWIYRRKKTDPSPQWSDGSSGQRLRDGLTTLEERMIAVDEQHQQLKTLEHQKAIDAKHNMQESIVQFHKLFEAPSLSKFFVQQTILIVCCMLVLFVPPMLVMTVWPLIHPQRQAVLILLGWFIGVMLQDEVVQFFKKRNN